MRIKASPLVIIETIAVVAFVILLGYLGYQNSNPSRQLQPHPGSSCQLQC